MTIMFLRACTEMNGALARVERSLDNCRYEVCMHSSSVYPGEMKSLPFKNLILTQEGWSDPIATELSRKDDHFTQKDKERAKGASKSELQEVINMKLFGRD